MKEPLAEMCFDPRVGVVEMAAPSYADECAKGDEEMTGALRRVASRLGWADDERGAFSNVIAEGARVLVKPNLVMHENFGPWGMEPLVTHASLIRAAVVEALRAGAAEVSVGDAPLQGCDFGALMRATGLDEWAAELRRREPRFKGVRDFRRTISVFEGGVRKAAENVQPEDKFVLFDLGGESLLEPVTDGGEQFRVTCYDPRLLARTHAPGRHQYLVAREIVEADVVVNLPKLKTHKKAGLTCALKNLIGINGNKEFLPHHRVGGSKTGGDCYAGGGRLKSTLELLADRQNMARSEAAAKVLHTLSRPINRALRMMGESWEIEGAWSGNDTIWRTCLDLNRVLLYGRADGTLADEVQRRVIHVVDAVVAGQGDGPLAPQPLPLGLLLAGSNAAAVDWVSAHLLGYDPSRIPIARGAFESFRWPLVRFSHDEVSVAGDLGEGAADELVAAGKHGKRASIFPAGWLDAVARVKVGSNGDGASSDVVGVASNNGDVEG